MNDINENKNVDYSITDQLLKNKIFNNVFNSVLRDYSPLFSRYKYLNIIQMCIDVKGQITQRLNKPKKVKQRFIVENINILIHFLNIDNIKLYGSHDYKNELINELEPLVQAMDDKLSNDDAFSTIRNKIDAFLKEHKMPYFDASFKQLKNIYNNWKLNSRDIDVIFNIAYNFVSTRLTYGFSWQYVRRIILKTIGGIDKVKDNDFIEGILSLQTKHKTLAFEVYLPLKRKHTAINDKNIIDSFNMHFDKGNILTGEDLIEILETSQNTAHFSTSVEEENYYLHFNTKALDPTKALLNVITKYVPRILGNLSIIFEHISVLDTSDAIVFSREKNINMLSIAFPTNSSSEFNGFKDTFCLFPSEKFKKIISAKKELGSWNDYYINPYIRQKNLYDSTINIHHRVSTGDTLREIFDNFIDEFNFKDSKKTINQLVIIDMNLEKVVGKMISREREFGVYAKNDVSYFDWLYSNFQKSTSEDVWINYQNSLQWLQAKEITTIEKSISWFRNVSIFGRNSFLHSGDELSFFVVLASETYVSIITQILIKLVVHNLKTTEKVENYILQTQKYISDKRPKRKYEFNFEGIKEIV